MTIFDDIRKDRKAGTPGDWRLDSSSLSTGYPIAAERKKRSGGTNRICSVLPANRTETAYDEAEGNARRIARVPRLERIALAAEKMAIALMMVEGQRVYVSNDGFAHPHETDASRHATRALAAFRAACGEGE